MIARAFGPYQPIERLERGGPHTTYRAVDPRLFGQPIAVTTFDAPAGDEEFVQRFERDAQALTAIRHPNILPLLDFGEAGGQVYLATPYLEGPTLAAVLGGPRRPVEALGLIATLCDALDHAHRLGLGHGALEPGAILLANLPPGEDTLSAAWPILIDYGFAGLAGTAADGPAPSPYTPPERRPADAPQGADLYALAGVLHLTLTGVPPAPGGVEAALAPLPPGLATALRRALAAEPSARFASGADFVMALRDVAAAERRGGDDHAGALLDEARNAVTAGKLRAASEAYGAYLLVRPQDELARREFATVESRRAEIARRRAEAAAASAAAAVAAATGRPGPVPSLAPPAPPGGPTSDAAPAPGGDAAPVESGWAATASAGAPPEATGDGRFGLRKLLAFGGVGRTTPPGGVPLGPGGLGTTRSAGRGATPRTFKPIAAPARQRRQAVLPAVLGAVVLILALALGGAALARRGEQAGNPEPTVPAAVGVGSAPASVRPAAGVTRTPTRPAPSGPPPIPVAPVIPTLIPTIAPTLPPLPPAIAEGFDDPNTGFPRLGDTQPGAGYQNGEYVLLVPEPDGFAIAELTGGRCLAIVPGCSFGDLTVEVDVRAVGPTNGGSYGLVFHRQFVGGYLQYFVLIDPEKGEVRLVRWSDTERLEVIKPTALPSIARGEGKNHLTITAKGQTITVGVNGTNLPPITDAGPTTGLVALRADAGTGPIAVHFDGFIIRPAR